MAKAKKTVPFFNSGINAGAKMSDKNSTFTHHNQAWEIHAVVELSVKLILDKL